MSVNLGSGCFEIVDGAVTVIDGVIKTAENFEFSKVKVKKADSVISLRTDDFYKELCFRGYQHVEKFQLVREASATTEQAYGKICWDNNYVSFTDCMLQLIGIGNDSRDLFLPTGIRKITINPQRHEEILRRIADNEDEKVLDVLIDSNLKVMQSGGIEIWGLDASFVNRRRSPNEPVLEVYSFVPHFPTPTLSKLDMAKFSTELLLQNVPTLRPIVIEIDANDGKEPISEFIVQALDNFPLIVPDVTYLTEREVELKDVTVKADNLEVYSKISFLIKSNIVFDKAFFADAVEKLDASGLVLSRENEKLDSFEVHESFKFIACITLDNEWIYVLQRIKNKIEIIRKAIKIPAQIDDFKWLEDIKRVKEPTVIYSQIENNMNSSGIVGLVNCLRKEPNGQNFFCFLIEDGNAPDFDLNHDFYKNQLNLNLPINVFKNGQWGSYKHLTLPTDTTIRPRSDHCFVNLTSRGDMSSLTWMTGSLNPATDNLVKIHYAALNFRDIMVATMRISLDFEMENRIQRQYICGYEFSGIASGGRRVMGLAQSKAFATHMSEDEVMILEIPDMWSLEQAATVPVVYMTVYTAFFYTTTIERGKSILIHAGSGGVGLAAIRIAIAYDLEVFTTVSTDEKKTYLLETFPQLKSERIGNSRDTSFEQMVMELTEGKGVDYVLNCLSDEKMQASVRCLADNGCFLEVGKFDMLMKNKIHLNHFLRGITFKAVLFRVKDMMMNESRVKVSLNPSRCLSY